MQQQLVVGCRVGVARQRQMAPVGGGQMDIDHLQGGELLQDRARRESRRTRACQVFQGDVQAVGDEGDEDVRLDAFLALMEDRPDCGFRSNPITESGASRSLIPIQPDH